MSSTSYDRQTSFALFSAENPTSQQSGTDLDAEFNAVKISLDDTQQNLALIQDDDGVLKRGSVGQAQFDSSVTLGFAAPAQWASGVVYDANVSTVFHDSIFYIANATHTSGVSFDASKWDEIADFTAAAAIPDGSITSAKLATGAVAGDKLADGVVANSKLATGAVTTNKLADSNVTAQKLGADVPAALVDGIFPAGMVVPFAGSAAPTGWLLCQGQSVLRVDYPSLFAAIGTTYGSVDGTHFTLPDTRGRVLAGADGGANRLTSSFFGSVAVAGAVGGSESTTLTLGQLPTGITSSNASQSISVTVTSPSSRPIAALLSASETLTFAASGSGANISPAGNANGQWSGITQMSGATSNNISVTSNNTSGNPHRTVQPTLVLNYIVKAH